MTWAVEIWYFLQMGGSCLYLLSTAHVQTIPVCRAHIQNVPFSKAHVQSIPHLYSQCPVCTSYLHVHPMSSLYGGPLSKGKCVNGIPNVYSPCPAFTPIFTDHVQRVLHVCSRNLDKSPSLQHLADPCPISTPSLLPTSSQYTIFSTHSLTEYHFSCP